MITFIGDNRELHGVELICNVLPIAHPPITSTSRSDKIHCACRRGRGRGRGRDIAFKPEIVRVFAENFAGYGVRKIWRQMVRDWFDIARYTVERLMRDISLQGVIRGKPVRTTFGDKAAPCLLDHGRSKGTIAASIVWDREDDGGRNAHPCR